MAEESTKVKAHEFKEF
jgi:hypothetical protein